MKTNTNNKHGQDDDANPDKYPAIIGDQLPDGSTFSVGDEGAKTLPLTANYISAITEDYNDVGD